MNDRQSKSSSRDTLRDGPEIAVWRGLVAYLVDNGESVRAAIDRAALILETTHGPESREAESPTME